MSEATAKSQVRFSEKTDDPTAPASLVDLADLKLYYGVTDNVLDTQLTAASNIVTAIIRAYTGRVLSKGSYVEIYTDIFEPKVERYLIETPVEHLDILYSGTLLNKRTGRILLPGGPSLEVRYVGGYDPIPPDLFAVFAELVRQQMGLMGYNEIGTLPPVTAPIERAVTVGTLRVDYAIAATSTQAKAFGGGALSGDALAPYESILLQYVSYRKLAAT